MTPSHYRIAFEQSDDDLMLVNSDGMILESNTPFASSDTAYLAAVGHEIQDGSILDSLEQCINAPVQWSAATPSSSRWVSISAEPADGNLLLIHHRNPEQTSVFRHLSAILQGSNKGYVELDTNGQVVDANTQGLNLLGLDGSVNPDTHLMRFHDAFQSGEAYRSFTYNVQGDVYAEVELYQHNVGTSVFLTDISLRKQVEHELRRRTKEFNEFKSAIPVGVAGLRLKNPLPQDVDPAEAPRYLLRNLVIETINQTFRNMLAITDNETGRRLSHFLWKERRVLDMYRRFVENDYSLSGFVRSVTLPSGEKRWYQHTLHGVFDGKDLDRVWYLAHDVTEQHNIIREINDASVLRQSALGHDIHDTLGSAISGVWFKAQRLIENELPNDSAKLAEDIEEDLNQINKDTRTLAHKLSPVQLKEDGLVQALAALKRSLQSTKTDVNFPFQLPENEIEAVDEAATQQLYYVTKEACTNALKHGDPSRVLVQLVQKGEELRLLIADDGAGLQRSPGFGIKSMRYRAEMVEADFQIRTEPAIGTLIQITLPLNV